MGYSVNTSECSQSTSSPTPASTKASSTRNQFHIADLRSDRREQLVKWGAAFSVFCQRRSFRDKQNSSTKRIRGESNLQNLSHKMPIVYAKFVIFYDSSVVLLMYTFRPLVIFPLVEFALVVGISHFRPREGTGSKAMLTKFQQQHQIFCQHLIMM